MFDINMPVAAIPASYREFLPSLTTPAVDSLIREYEEGEESMRNLHTYLMHQDNRETLRSFAFGVEVYRQSKSSGHSWAMDLVEMFTLSRAIDARQEHFWFQLFDLCAFTSILPSDIWNKWHASFTAWRKGDETPIPRFDKTTVYSVLSLIESHRANFFSMRVDAVWTALSGWHKTNVGSAFHDNPSVAI